MVLVLQSPLHSKSNKQTIHSLTKKQQYLVVLVCIAYLNLLLYRKKMIVHSNLLSSTDSRCGISKIVLPAISKKKPRIVKLRTDHKNSILKF